MPLRLLMTTYHFKGIRPVFLEGAGPLLIKSPAPTKTNSKKEIRI